MYHRPSDIALIFSKKIFLAEFLLITPRQVSCGVDDIAVYGFLVGKGRLMFAAAIRGPGRVGCSPQFDEFNQSNSLFDQGG